MKRLETESEAYARAREQLLREEIALKDHVRRVAELRRTLPADTALPEDYVFVEGPADLALDGPIRQVRLSDLFEQPDKPLLLNHFMYGEKQTEACPMCSMWADGYNAVARHLAPHANFVTCVAAPIESMRAWARMRGWRHLRMVSSYGTSFKTDFKMQDSDGAQHPGLSVFTRAEDGSARHFYTCEAVLGEGHWNGVDLMSPVWNLLDLLPAGRGEWFPSLEYD